MNKNSNIFTAKHTFYASLLFAAALLVFLAPRAAVNVDEQLHYPHAKKVVNWYFTGGKDTSSLETPVTNLKYYGQSVDNLTALVNRIFSVDNEFAVRHYTGALFFLMLLFFAGIIGYQISGSYWVSALAVLSLLAMPRLSGQAFGNLKDVPFATGYTAGICFIIQFLKQMPRPRWSTAVWLGLAIAFTSSVRIGGLILLAYTALFTAVYFFLLKPFVPKQNVSTKPCLVRLLGQLTVIGIIGYFAALLFWPFALQDVLRNPLESLRVMEHYKVSIRQIFEGNLYWSSQLPWYYLPKWLFISTPEFIFSGVILYLIFFMNKNAEKSVKQLFLELFLVFTLLFPVLYVIVIKANLYSGVRQMLFVLPSMAVISSLGIFRLLKGIKKRPVRISLLVFFSLLLFLPVKHQTTTFPADYIYFNSLSGGNKAAWGNYEYDYYFHGIKNSSEYLIDIIGEEEAIVATNCNLSNYFENTKNISYKYVRYLERSSADWDYGLFGINYIHPELLENGKWFSIQTEKIFFHRGNPIVVLLKRVDKSAYAGLELIKKGETEQGKALVESALHRDKNNVWLYAQLAKISLKDNDFESFERYLQQGREIYASYEPLYLLEAQYFYNLQKFEAAKKVLDKLILVNNRYKQAAPLLEAVNKKLGNISN